jgi:hypothetical protein
METPIPEIPNVLLKILDERFPDHSPRLEDDDRLIWFKAGQRSVVAFLMEQSRRQNETIFGAS